mgnify:CR=1 FL=1
MLFLTVLCHVMPCRAVLCCSCSCVVSSGMLCRAGSMAPPSAWNSKWGRGGRGQYYLPVICKTGTSITVLCGSFQVMCTDLLWHLCNSEALSDTRSEAWIVHSCVHNSKASSTQTAAVCVCSARADKAVLVVYGAYDYVVSCRAKHSANHPKRPLP